MAELSEKSIVLQDFSLKQALFFTWTKDDTFKGKDMIIANGAVRAGKTLAMSIAFVLWAFENFDKTSFIIGGQTKQSVTENLLAPLDSVLKHSGFKTNWNEKSAIYTVKGMGKTNFFNVFGGSKSNSWKRVQGLTAGGALIDEAVICEESFLDQVMMRLSEEGAKTWISCNPDSPSHWFYKRFLEKQPYNVLRINFLMEDNPSLTPETIKRLKSPFSGVRRERYIEGKWVSADGLIYAGFSKTNHVIDKLPNGVTIMSKYIGIDYGLSNATVFISVGIGDDGNVYVLDEFYHSQREEDKNGISITQKTAMDYAKDYRSFSNRNSGFRYSFIDPSALPLERAIRRIGATRGLVKAKNDVLDGIALVDSLISSDKLYVLSHCVMTIDEMLGYKWDVKAIEDEVDKPVKVKDHLMDALRYAIYTRANQFINLLPKI